MEPFEPYRVVGSVCGAVPASATLLYGTPMLMVAVGRTFQLYKGKEMAMVRGGPTYESPIAAVAQAGRYRAVAEGPRVHVLSHHKPLWSAAHEPVTQPEVTLLLAQDELLFCVGADRRVAVRELKSGRVLQEMLVADSEEPTCLALLPWYGNKLLLGTAEGSLQLFNYKTGACLWHSRRRRCADRPGDGEEEGGVSALACSVFKDIVAYGTTGGGVVLLQLARDEVITRFEHESGAAVTALAFRADRGDGSLLVSGTSRGDVVVWDLEARCMDGVLTRSQQVQTEQEVLERPHMGAVHTLVTFPPQPQASSADNAQLAPLLVTAGSDNALMQFRFDTVDGRGLLVRERRGHMGAVTTARFFNGDLLVTAGADRALRVTHVFSDRASWELSQGRLGKRGRERQAGREALKVPPATRLASSTTRNYQWASLVSLHTASAALCAWRMDTRALDFKLSAIETSAHTAKAVTVSDCGNYAVVGYTSGHLAMITLQNHGIRHLVDPDVAAASGAGAAGGTRAHTGSVECVEVTASNGIVVSAGLDGVIKLWDLVAAALLERIPTGEPMTVSCAHPSALFIVAQTAVLAVYAVDARRGPSAAAAAATTVSEAGRRPVRVFRGHRSPITAVALAPDSQQYVVSASADAALLLWDLAAVVCVGQYRFHAPALSLHFHPDGLFLVSTHAGERGAFLWVNALRYGYAPEVVADPLANATEDLPLLHLPVTHGGAEAAEAAPAAGDDNEEEAADRQAGGEQPELFDETTDIALAQRRRREALWARLDAIAADGLTLSRLPRSTWLSLTVLDQIKEKNQPLLPPKKKDVPFFLPTTSELRPTFIVALESDKQTQAGQQQQQGPASAITHAEVAALTPLQTLLLAGDHAGAMRHLLEEGRTAGGMDLALRRVVDYTEGLAYTAGELQRITECARALLRFFIYWLERQQQADLVQGLLAAALKAHGPLLTRLGPQTLAEELQRLTELQEATQRRLDHLLALPYALSATFSGTATW